MRKLVYECNVSLDGFADHTAAGVVDDELHYFSAVYLTIPISNYSDGLHIS